MVGKLLGRSSKPADYAEGAPSATVGGVTDARNGQQQDLNLNLAQVAQEAEALVGDQAQPLPPPPPAEPVNPPDGTQ